MILETNAQPFDSTITAVERSPVIEASPMDSMKLAQLDIGLFRHLLWLGTGRKEMCSLFLLGDNDYDYVVKLIS